MSNRFDDMRVKGINTNDATATATDIVSGKTAYVGGHKITGILSPGGGSDNWNVFLQNSEPQTKNGVWIKTNGSANPSVYFSTTFSARGDFINSSNLSYMNGFNSQTQVIIGDYMFAFSYYTYGAIKYDLKNKRIVEQFTMPNTGTTLQYVYACEYNSEIHIFTYVNNAYLEYYKYYPSSGTFSEVTTLTSINTTDPYCCFFTQINDYVYWYQYSYYTGRESGGLLRKISLETGTLTRLSSNPFRGVYTYSNYTYKREAIATTGDIVFLLDSTYSTQYPTNPDYNKTQLIKVDLSTGETGTLIGGVPAFGRIYASGNFLYLFPVGTNNNYYIYDINNDTWESLPITNSYTIYSFDGYFAGDYTCFDYSSGIVYIRNGSDMIGFQVVESPESQDLDVGTVVIGENLAKRITKIQDSSNIHVGIYDTYIVTTENGNKYLDGSHTSFFGDGLKWNLIKNPSGETCTVSFDLNGGSGTIPSQQVILGQTATQPSNIPIKTNNVFVGWYLDDKPFNFNFPIVSNTTLVAHYEAYTFLNYIESTGTQYIDTGVIPNQNTGFDIEFIPISAMPTRTNSPFFLNSGGAKASLALDQRLGLSCYPVDGVGSSEAVFGSQKCDPDMQTNNYEHIVLLNKVLTTTGGNDKALSTADFTSPNTMYIFCANQTDGTTDRYSKMKLYSLKIYDGNALVRDFVPALYNNTPCLYDKITKTFFYNAGTGTFNYGEVVE